MPLYVIPIYNIDKEPSEALMWTLKAPTGAIARRKVFNTMRGKSKRREYVGEAQDYAYKM